MTNDQWHKLDDRLHAVETQTSLIVSTLKTELGGNGTPGHLPRLLATLREELLELKAHLLGTAEHPGVVMRLDRLEIVEHRRQKLISAVLVALASLVVKAGWELLKG